MQLFRTKLDKELLEGDLIYTEVAEFHEEFLSVLHQKMCIFELIIPAAYSPVPNNNPPTPHPPPPPAAY